MSQEATSSEPSGAQIFEAIFIGVSQKRTFTGTSAQSAATGVNTSIVRLSPDQDCFVSIGVNPTAAPDTSLFLAAGAVEYFACKAGDKVAVIQKTTGGNLYITEGA